MSIGSHILLDLEQSLSEHGFQQVTNTDGLTDIKLLLKRQTWNTNRAVVVVSPQEMPPDFNVYLKTLRNRVAFRCGFFPLLWGIGIQIVVVSPGALQSAIELSAHVARVDNQWAIVQSIFLADSSSQTFCSARTWGQFVTGKFQDAISVALSRHFKSSDKNA